MKAHKSRFSCIHFNHPVYSCGMGGVPMQRFIVLLASIPLLAASLPQHVDIVAVPPEIVILAERTIAGIRITGATIKERDGRQYYDVEGLRPDGAEVELDMLRTSRGWEVVEIQRDIAWTEVPSNARSVVTPALKGMVPVRIIESRQVDGRIIYELFSPDAADAPAFEVMMHRGKVSVLTTPWLH